MWHMDDWGWWMMMGWIWMVVFWGLIIWAVVTIVGRLSSGDGDRAASPGRSGSNAQAILEERFARGEITREEFEEMRRTLRE